MKVLVITNMYPNSEQAAFGAFVRDQVEALREAGVEIDVLFVNGRKHTLNYLWGIFRFWWMLLKKRYHVIHAHYAISGFIARLQFLYPIVVTYHGGEVKDHVPYWLRSFARRGPKLFDRIIVTNRLEKDILRHDLKVRVIPCGINLDEFKPASMIEARHLLGLPVDKPLILWAGECWQPEKRFGLVKDSLEVLKQRCPEAELILVSGKPHSVIPIYMNACDVLVLTSLSEGSPMVIKEAMSCNLPIVSTDVGDVAEIIAGVEGCCLCEPNPQEVARKLIKVLARRQRTKGRQKINCLDSKIVSQKIIGVYEELCPSKEFHNIQLRKEK